MKSYKSFSLLFLLFFSCSLYSCATSSAAIVEAVDFSSVLYVSEVESLRKVVPLEKGEVCAALCDIKKFLHTKDEWSFERLQGGDCNAPILAFKFEGMNKISLGVFKRERDAVWAEKRLRAIDEMKKDGFENLPRILKDKDGSYLVALGDASYFCMEYLVADADQLIPLNKCSF